ncbi:hypothetical protein [Oribacterium sinus]
MRREKLLLLGYPGQWGSQFLWKKIREEKSCPFSKTYIEEEEERLRKLPRLLLKGNLQGKQQESGREDLAEEREKVSEQSGLSKLPKLPKLPVLSAENILLFSEGEKKGQSIPLYEEDLQAKWNAGELSLGKVEDLFPNWISDFGISEILPLGRGGILSGLWQLSGGGFSFSYEKIPFLQGTIELCEHFQISPYYLYSENAYLLRLEEVEAFSELARERGIIASCIGISDEGKKRMRRDAQGESFLTKRERDSLEELFSKKELEESLPSFFREEDSLVF